MYVANAVSFVLLVVSAAVMRTSGETHSISWDRAGLASYTPGNPLIVNVRDNLIITCPDDNYDIWILTREEQYDSCRCSIAPYTCKDDAKIIVDPCLPNLENTFPILNQPANLGSVFEFEPGSTFYLAAFLVNALSGNCTVTGLRMVLMVPNTANTEKPSSSTTDGRVSSNSSKPLDSGGLNRVDEAGLTNSNSALKLYSSLLLTPLISVVTLSIISLFRIPGVC